MRPLLCALGFILMGAASVQADVLIYKGTSRIKTDVSGSAGFSGTIGLYLILDFDTRQSASVLTYTLGGKKRYQPSSPDTQNFTTAELKGGKTATILAGGSTTEIDSNNFDYFILSLRGVNSTVVVRKTPAPKQVNRPRAFAGYGLTVHSTSGEGTFIDQIVSATFQPKATVDANNANKTVAQAVQDIVAELEAKGYSTP